MLSCSRNVVTGRWTLRRSARGRRELRPSRCRLPGGFHPTHGGLPSSALRRHPRFHSCDRNEPASNDSAQCEVFRFCLAWTESPCEPGYTPGVSLQPFTAYYFQSATNFSDVAGNLGSGTYWYLTTGAGAVTTGPTVTISPVNGTTGAPVNTNVVAVASALLDPNTITNNSITVTPNGSTTAVPGTVTLASDLVTLTWVPTSYLTVSTTYNIQVGGFTDQNGNALTRASSFSTGTNGTPIGANSLVVTTITPSNGASSQANKCPDRSDVQPGDQSGFCDECPGSRSIQWLLRHSGSWNVINNGTQCGTTRATRPCAMFKPSQPYAANHIISVYSQCLLHGLRNKLLEHDLHHRQCLRHDGSDDHICLSARRHNQFGAQREGGPHLLQVAQRRHRDVHVGYAACWRRDPYLGSSISLSSDLMTVTMIPNASLITGHRIDFGESAALDLKGNDAGGNSINYVTVGSGADTTAPAVSEVSPPANLGGVPTNAQVQVEFSKEISPTSLAGFQLLQGSTPVPASLSGTRHETVATLTPNVPLNPVTTYTIAVSGVKDVRGNSMTSFTSQTFVTGPGVSLPQPKAFGYPDQRQTLVPTSTTIVIQFDQAMDPLTFNQSLAASGSGSYPGATLQLNSTGDPLHGHVLPRFQNGDLDSNRCALGSNAIPHLCAR